MALKDWKKTEYLNNNIPVWKNIKLDLLLEIKNNEVRVKNIYGFGHIIHSKSFKSKSQALKYTKLYMMTY